MILLIGVVLLIIGAVVVSRIMRRRSIPYHVGGKRKGTIRMQR